MTWRLTGYYGYPERDKRHLLWNLLRHLASTHNLPWLCMGDYNDLLSPYDKKGRVPHLNWLYRGFREATLDCNLTDIPIEGYPFTWSRGRGTEEFVEERLDRAMGILALHNNFPRTRLYNKVAPVSDHSPFVIDTSPIIR